MSENSKINEMTNANDGFCFVNPELRQSQQDDSTNAKFSFVSPEQREAQKDPQIKIEKDTNEITDSELNFDKPTEPENIYINEPSKFQFKSAMIRPILYRCISRCVTALTLVLLWKKFWSGIRPLSDACSVAAICLFAVAWFSYLRMDGVKFHHMMEERRKKRPRATLDLTDYADQHIVTEEELLPNERAACSLFASLIAGVIFVALTVVL